MFSEEGLEAAYQLAERLGLTCYVHAGQMYVMDGGTRSWREEGWNSGGHSSSYREATPEELDLWRALGGDPE